MDINNDDWEKQLFNEQFTQIVTMFSDRIGDDSTFTIQELQKYLDLAYANQDDNMSGNGRVVEIKNNARVAALEMVMQEWKALLEQ
ncbi:Uncharacterized protein QTN25_006877 [Entamoeba marina]